MMKLNLYHYWRSSSSWRVRWAFAVKGVECNYISVDLLNGESESAAHLARNPLGYVPVLEFAHPAAEFDNEQDLPPSSYLSESVAIMEWADETFPEPCLLPEDIFERAQVRSLVEIINADTQPLQNLAPQALHSDDPEKRKLWAQHWIRNGLSAYETAVQKTAMLYSFGDTLTMADLCLIPQCYNAMRYDISLSDYPTIKRIYDAAIKTESYRRSEPSAFEPKK